MESEPRETNQPRQSLRGIHTDLGQAPSVENIDKTRREALRIRVFVIYQNLLPGGFVWRCGVIFRLCYPIDLSIYFSTDLQPLGTLNRQKGTVKILGGTGKLLRVPKGGPMRRKLRPLVAIASSRGLNPLTPPSPFPVPRSLLPLTAERAGSIAFLADGAK